MSTSETAVTKLRQGDNCAQAVFSSMAAHVGVEQDTAQGDRRCR
jgi:hypothetical protein